MSKLADLTGQQFGRLTAERLADRKLWRSPNAHWHCQCVCGNEIVAAAHNLRSGHTKSCGCYNLDRLIERSTKHGMTGTPEFKSWTGMIERCDNPNNKHYAHYGGRGIKVAPEFYDFETWYAHIGPRPEGHTQDRIDNDRGYEPGNVRWATPSQQRRNQRRSKTA